MFTDYVYRGEMHGAVAEALHGIRFEPGLMRPFIGEGGQNYVTVNTGRRKSDGTPIYRNVRVTDLATLGLESPVANATALPKGAWIQIDTAVQRAARLRLSAWSDLIGTGNRVGGFDAMAKLTYEYHAISDPGEAIVDMEGLAEGRVDKPLYTLRSLPLPIIHSDFYMSRRELAVTRATGSPIDTTMAEASGRRISEMAEQILIGTQAGLTFGTQTTGYGTHEGTSTIYGYTTFPARIVMSGLATPTGSNPDAIIANVLDMIELLQSNRFFGPYMLYHSTGYTRYLNNDYFRSGSTSAIRTVRERILEVSDILDVKRLDYLTTNYQMILVQMTPDVVQAIEGMPIVTVQWESQGGMRVNFKTMAIMVPLFRSDYNGRCGICHASS